VLVREVSLCIQNVWRLDPGKPTQTKSGVIILFFASLRFTPTSLFTTFLSGCRAKGTICCYATEMVAMKPACECCGEINPQLKKNPAVTI